MGKLATKRIARIAVACFAIAVLCIAVAPETFAAVGNVLSFQGRLTDDLGNLLGGQNGTTYYYRFTIYDAATGGSSLWSSHGSSGVPVKTTQGVFNVLLGDTSLTNMSSLSESVFEIDPLKRWLEVRVSTISAGSGFELMQPRMRIGSALTARSVFGGIASVSALTINGVPFDPNAYLPLTGGTLTGDVFGTNASLSGTFESALVKATTIGSDAGLTLAPTSGLTNITGRASISSNLEVGGYASASQYFGGGLTSCTGTTNKLTWSAGVFSCATDQTGTAFGGIEIIESGGTFGTHYGSLSFNSGAFDVSFPTASSSLVKLDWTNGPASRSIAQTITGLWTFSGGASFSGPVEISNRASISVLTLGGTVFNPNAYLLLSGGTLTGHLDFTTASGSSFESSLVKATTIDSDTNLVGITANATVSGNFEVTGYSSASQTFGSGLTSCSGAGQKLLWVNGLFTCGTDLQGSGGTAIEVREGFVGNGSNFSSVSFAPGSFNLDTSNADARLSLDWGLGGPASLSQNETVTGTWTFQNGASFSSIESQTASVSSLTINGTPFNPNAYLLLSGGTLTGDLFGTNASWSGSVELTGGGFFKGNLQGNATTTTSLASNPTDCLASQFAQSIDASGNLTCAAIVDGDIPDTLTASNYLPLTGGTLTGALFGTYASFSGSLEIAGAASASSTFGSGLTTCTGADEFLQYNASTGQFSCGTDTDIAYVWKGLSVREGTGSFTHIGSVSFKDLAFDVSYVGSESFVNLDWNTGPASLSQNETVTGTWTFQNGASFSSIEAQTASVSSLTINGTPFNPNAYLLLSGGTLTGHLGLTTASGSNIELSGFASASQFFGAGLTNCGTTQKLQFASGTFTCVADFDTDTNTLLGVREVPTGFANFSSLSFSASGFTLSPASPVINIGIDYVNGPASRSIAQAITGLWTFANGASVSGSLEIVGTASVSALTLDTNGTLSGAGLVNCNTISDKLTWFNGQFGCGTDAGSGGGTGTLEIREFGASFDGIPATASFAAAHFALTSSGSSDVSIRLDWGAGGPASLSQNETVTGTWTFQNGASFSSIESQTASVSSLTINGTPFNPNAYLPLTGGTLTGALFGTYASFSGSLEIAGAASASSTFGSGLTTCTGADEFLQYNASTGQFSCGTDTDIAYVWKGLSVREGTGSFTHIGSVSFKDLAFDVSYVGSESFVNLDWNTGPASLSQNETVTGTWTFQNGASFSSIEAQTASVSSLTINGTPFNPNAYLLLSGGTLTGHLGLTTASGSNIELSGFASASQFFGAGLTNCGTTQKLQFASGTFTCVADFDTDTNTLLGVREVPTGFANFSSLSFSASGFTLSPASPVINIGIDYVNGPASRSIAQAITGLWTFANGASVSGSLEIVGTASVSALTLDTNGTLSGAGLVNCNTISDKLTWFNGQFGCGTDAGSGGGTGTLEIREFGASFDGIPATASFAAAHFALTSSGSSDVSIRLDWGAGGPASLSQNETVTGTWTFQNGASFSSIEAQTASISVLTVGGVTINPANFRPASNSLDWDEFSNAMTVDANTTITGGAFNITFDHASTSGTFETAILKATTIGSDAGLTLAPTSGLTNITGRASISSNLEVGGYASASQYFGGGLTSCTGTANKLVWSAGVFSCATDQTGTAFGGIEIIESGGTFGTHYGSLSFNSGAFDVSFPTASSSLVKLDWTNGPASRSIAQTITGLWTFSGGASFSGPVEISNRASISVLTVGGVTINPANFRPASNSLDWDEFSNAMTVDANTTITGGAFNITFDHASTSGTFETAILKATTIGSDAGLTLAPTSGLTNITGRASISSNLEVGGYASASQYFGGGLTSCTGTANKLVWSAGVFSCATDQTGTAFGGIEIIESGGTFGTHYGSLSFNSGAFDVSFPTASSSLVKLDWTNGPASRSIAQTITGLWTFSGGASFSGPVEISNRASISVLTVGGVTINPANFRPASNSLDWDEFSNAMTVDANTTITGGAFNITFDHASTSGTFETAILKATTIGSDAGLTLAPTSGLTNITGRASISSNLEVGGYASASQYFGGGLTSCTGTANKLVWSAGVFSCATDQTGTAFGGIEIIESGGTFGTHYGSLSFNSGAFDVSFPTASSSLVKLDWTNGPASRSIAQTITGLWTFSGGASFSGPVEISNRASISVLTVGGVTINPANFRPASNSLDWDEFSNAMTVDANTTITGGAFNITFDHASTSGTFETAILKATTIGSDAGLTLAPTSGLTNITGRASISSNLEVGGYASASQYFGGGLTSCTGTTNKLTWSAGVFSCATDQTGTAFGGIEIIESGGTFGTHYGSLSFNSGAFDVSFPTASSSLVKLDWTNGPASRSIAQTITGLWTFSGGASFSGPVEISNRASISVLTVGGVTINPANFRPASNSLDWDEFSNAMTVDANTTITGGAFNITFDHASTSGTFETAILKATTIGSDAGLTLAPTSGLTNITGRASISSNLEVGGYASASQYFGGGLTSCTAANNFLQYNSSTGRFSCAVSTGSGAAFKGIAANNAIGGAFTTHIGSLSFDANSFVFSSLASVGSLRINWSDSGVASRSTANTWGATNTFGTVSNGASFSAGGLLTFAGTARPTRDITLVPEYPGATMSSTSASCTTCTGLMTSDNETASPYRNFYKWRSTQVASQAYDVWVKVDLPDDFSSLSSISVEGFRTSTNDRVYFALFDTANTQSGSTAGKGTSVATSNGAWTSIAVAAPSGTYAAGQSVTFRIRMEANQNQFVRVGKIRLEYLSRY